jgi:hypothetical protein
MDASPVPVETTETPEAAALREKRARRAGKIRAAVSILALLVVVMIYFGRKVMMGTKYAVSDKESVNYSGSTTEAEAKHLGEVLKSVGYFTGARELDVLFKKDAKDGTVVSFVLSGKWNDAEIIAAFRQIGAAITAEGLGKPLTVKLLDDHLNTKNELKIE